MPLPIQRQPRGLAAVLSLFGGKTPQVLMDEIRGHVDLLQFYGATQKQIRSVTNAAAAVNTFVTLTVPSNETWILFHCAPSIIAPAGLTDFTLAATIEGSTVSWAREGAGIAVGEICPCAPFVPPYPYVLLPGSQLSAVPLRISGAANLSCTLTASVGVLG